MLLYKAEPGIFTRKITLFFFPKHHLVVPTGDDTTLSLAERQIKMHPAPSPAPPPAICSSPAARLQPPPPANKLFVHLCYEQGYWNNQGLKRTVERKQNPPKGRWSVSDGNDRAKGGEACQLPKSGWGRFTKMFGHWRNVHCATAILVMNSAISLQIET